MLAIGYLFLGGVGAGALVVLSVLECANARRRFGSSGGRTRLGRTFVGRAIGPLRVDSTGRAGELRYFEGGYTSSESNTATDRYFRAKARAARALALPSEFFARAWAVCLVALAGGILCLVLDLGRPDRLLGLLLSPSFSAMTVGAYALAAALACAVSFSAIASFDGLFPSTRIVYALSLVGLASGLVSAAYTGVLLSGLASVLFWRTAFLPILFTVSAVSCGIACVLLTAAFVEGRQSVARPLANLVRIDSAAIAVEAAILLTYLAWGLSDSGAASAAWALVAGDLHLWFWGIAFAVGLVVPFVMERFVAHGNYRTQLVWIAAAVLLGGFALRLCIVSAGAYDVTQMADGMNGLSAAVSALA